jgi:AAA domain, putative AbiEii toxin, Type IV TA system/Protein of unknown function (DUF4435)
LADSEREYLRTNADKLLTMQAWREIVPETYGWRYLGMTPLAAHLRAHDEEVKEHTSDAIPLFIKELERPSVIANLIIFPSGEVKSTDSRILETLFSTYEPLHMGIIDYHGAHRQYNREQFGGINLNLDTSEQKMKQHALYGYSNKYSNLKQEMASSYVKHLLAREAGGNPQKDDRLTLTLKELFTTFFPGKEFLGPQPTPDGSIQFHVKTPSGALHDIDDLSAGEKEVLYGYLRMRNSAPKHSVLLIDEPELHLNPRLISGLASFYRRYLAQELSNQLWLVTHSDTLIREAVGQEGYKVFHMQPPDRGTVPNQATLMTASDHVERVVIDLVGDLAAYRPGAKIVLFEGGGDTDFDVRMTCSLFPRFQTAVNPISSGNKRRVRDLHKVLEDARITGAVPGMFFSITDRDSDSDLPAETSRQLSWDVYHIENYLLEPRYILRVLQDLIPTNAPTSEQEVHNQLQEAAHSAISRLVSHRMRCLANDAIVRSLDLGFDPGAPETERLLQEAIERSKKKIDAVLANELSPATLKNKNAELTREYNTALQDGTWRKEFPGRIILSTFCGKANRQVRYEHLRDLTIARMRDDGFEPPGMKVIVEQILKEPWR